MSSWRGRNSHFHFRLKERTGRKAPMTENAEKEHPSKCNISYRSTHLRATCKKGILRRQQSVWGRSARQILLVAIGAGLGACAASATAAQLTLLVDESQSMPGGDSNFKAFSAPALNAVGEVAWQGTGNRSTGELFSGIYIHTNGSIQTIADFDSPYVDADGQDAGVGNFSLFQEQVLLNDSGVGFKGFDPTKLSSSAGLFSTWDGALHRIVDTSVAVPDKDGLATTSTFTGLSVSGMDASGILFRGWGSAGERGLYLWTPTASRLVVDNQDTVPGLSSRYSGFSIASIDGDDIVFRSTFSADGSFQLGIFVRDSTDTVRTVRLVADTRTAIPGGTGTFTKMWHPDVEGGAAYFQGEGDNGQTGIYSDAGGALYAVADTGTPIPGGTGNFTSFAQVAAVGTGVVFFGAGSSGDAGVYFADASGVSRVIAKGDELDGRTVSHVRFDPEGAGEGKIALSVIFSDDWRAVYVAQLVELNQAPVADAGADRVGAVGDELTLSGGNSSDDETPLAQLTYEWTLVSAPSGSTAVLQNASSIAPALTPDLPGEFIIELVVRDEEGVASAADSLAVTAEVDPAFVFQLLFNGISTRERVDHLTTWSNDVHYPLKLFDSGIGTWHFVRDGGYDALTGSYNQTYDAAFASLDSTGLSTRLAGVGDVVSGTEDVLRSTSRSSSWWHDIDSITFSGRTVSPDGVRKWEYLKADSQGLSRNFELPMQVDGETESLKRAYQWKSDGLFRGGNGTCRSITRSTGTYCYSHQGLYEVIDGVAHRIVDVFDVVPGRSEQFISFGAAARDSSGVTTFVGYWIDAVDDVWLTGLFRTRGDGTFSVLLTSNDDVRFYFSHIRTDDSDGSLMWSGSRYRLSTRETAIGIFRGDATPVVTNRDFSWLNSRHFSVGDDILLFNAARRDSDGRNRIGTYWMEDGTIRKAIEPGDEADGKVYDWAFSRQDALLGRSFVLEGRKTIEARYDSSTGDFRYEHHNDVLVARFDTDRDGIGDDLDNCPVRPNPDQADSAGNGIGDLCEDSDADSVADADDNCPLIANSLQEDGDLDGYGDACDVCPAVADDQSDSDGDGVGDACDDDWDNDTVLNDFDNCPLVANADQADLDLDTAGDVCDPDIDGDGIANIVDGTFENTTFTDESDIASVSFTDQHQGGHSFGEIASSGSLELWIEDAPDSVQGVVATALSGTGRAQLRQCGFSGKDGRVVLEQGSAVEITCGSVSVRTLVNRSELLLDDDVVIDLPEQVKARVIDSGGPDFLVSNEPESIFPLEMTLGGNMKVTLPIQAAAAVEESASNTFVIENDPSSPQPILVEKEGVVLSYRPGESGLPVAIDIKPGSTENSINLGSNGVVAVAILSTPAFDARIVDPVTVTLANSGVRLKGKGTPMASEEDVNSDGLLDLVVQVETEALEMASSDTKATVAGNTLDGVPILGRDTVRVVSE